MEKVYKVFRLYKSMAIGHSGNALLLRHPYTGSFNFTSKVHPWPINFAFPKIFNKGTI